MSAIPVDPYIPLDPAVSIADIHRVGIDCSLFLALRQTVIDRFANSIGSFLF